jgi:tRNA modification GTPase
MYGCDSLENGPPTRRAVCVEPRAGNMYHSLPMDLHGNDTIVALATAPGGALAVVRLSGPEALSIADQVFRGRRALASREAFTVTHGWIVDRRGERLDEVLVSVFRAPHSYTGEDLLEISCHGGALVSQRIVELLARSGARGAAPGEFTRRAFLNGRMDLSQAEAVADLIRSTSDRAHRASIEQLEGHLGAQVRKIRTEILECISLLELEIDFSEEGIDLVSPEELAARLSAFRQRLERARDSFERGRVYREGVSVAIVGRPNAGKSSIFNALLESNRAIVTAVAGTTRDTLEEGILIEGVLFRLTDTAGLRESGDLVEAEGLQRTRAAIDSSDALLVVVDAAASQERWREAVNIIPDGYSGQVLVLFNKSDLLGGVSGSAEEAETGPGNFVGIWTSALSGQGMARLRTLLAQRTGGSVAEGGEMFVTSRRHRDAFARAAGAVGLAVGALERGASNEFAAFDLREAVAALAEITGEVTSEELLNHIFGSFCIGK